MVEARVHAVGIDLGVGQAVVLLEEFGGTGRLLPVAVGEQEAVALAAALHAQPARARPDTHRLIGAVLAAFRSAVRRVRVHTLRDRVFHAELVLDDGTRVDARTSDAVVLALHAGADIEVADAVFEQAGVARETVTVEGPDELDRWRRFLETAGPDDVDPPDPGRP